MKFIGFLFLALVATTNAALADNTDQQNKMVTCNKAAEGMKGDERKAFMSNCLKKDKPTAQQERMTQCNKDAAGKTGDERKAFMSQCLKKSN
ncbi:MAG: PsiF family protein [Spongiibacteraceae bacterium]